MAINVQNVERFKFIAHKIIPLVYDDSLSYYEFLCKVMQKLNEVISSLDNQNEILKAFDEEILDWETSTDNKYNQFVNNIDALFEAFKQGEVAARTAFMDALVGSYNESTHYAIGQYVRYGNNVYKCTTATSGEAWNPAHWTQVVYADDLYNQLISKMQVYVNNWLAEHPEATTTVQDNSLTEIKFTNDLKLKTIKEYVTPQMFGAKGDGETDDTEAIQNALNTENGVIFFPDGVYLINSENSGWGHLDEGGIHPKSNTTIILSSNAILKAITTSSSFYNIISISDCENIKIFGGHIIGDNDTHTGTSGEWGFGIGIWDSDNITIENVEIEKCWGDGIIIDNNSVEPTHTGINIDIINCHIHNCRRQGISPLHGKFINIDSCYIHNITGTSPQSGIDIEPDDTEIKFVTINNCTFENNTGADIIVNGGKSVIITNCVGNVNYYSCNDSNCIINNCYISAIYVRAEGLMCSNCKLGYISYNGGEAKFYNCVIESDKDRGEFTSLIDAQQYTIEGKGIELYNCTLTTNSYTKYAFFFTKRPVYAIFKNCEINDVNVNVFNWDGRFPNKVRFENCNISLKSTWACINFNSNTLELINTIWNNTNSEKANYLFSLSGSSEKTIKIVNSEINNFTNLTTTDSAKTGNFIFKNNIIVNGREVTVAPSQLTPYIDGNTYIV